VNKEKLKSLDAIIDDEMYHYQLGEKGKGGNRTGWDHQLSRLFKEHHDAIDTAGEELFIKAYGPRWEREPKPPEADLFDVLGERVPVTFTIHDKDEPGSYRKVTSCWATIQQAREDAWIKSKKAMQSVAAAAKRMAQVDAWSGMVDGKEDTEIQSLADEKLKRTG
jgi:hypothetical protein